MIYLKFIRDYSYEREGSAPRIIKEGTVLPSEESAANFYIDSGYAVATTVVLEQQANDTKKNNVQVIVEGEVVFNSDEAAIKKTTRKRKKKE